MDISELLIGHDHGWVEDRIYEGKQPNFIITDWDDESELVYIRYYDGDVTCLFWSDMRDNYISETFGFIIGEPINLIRNCAWYDVDGLRVFMYVKQEE